VSDSPASISSSESLLEIPIASSSSMISSLGFLFILFIPNVTPRSAAAVNTAAAMYFLV